MGIFIKNISIDKLRHLKKLEINLSNDSRKHLILTGKNASGKTSLLEAIKNYLSMYEVNKTYETLLNNIEMYEKNIKNNNLPENLILSNKNELEKAKKILIYKLVVLN